MNRPQPGDKCLSVRQPFAWLILDGLKRCENRKQPTTYRGRLWIHSARTLAAKAWHEVAAVPETPFDMPVTAHGITLPALSTLPLGAIVGSVRVVGCVRPDELPASHAEDRFAGGPWCWLLEDPEPLEVPIACKGALGLWTHKP